MAQYRPDNRSNQSDIRYRNPQAGYGGQPQDYRADSTYNANPGNHTAPRQNIGRLTAADYDSARYTNPQAPVRQGRTGGANGTGGAGDVSGNAAKNAYSRARYNQRGNQRAQRNPKESGRISYNTQGQRASSYVASQRSNSKAGQAKKRSNARKGIFAGVAAVAIICIGVFAFLYMQPVNITVSGKTYGITGAKTVQTAFDVVKPSVKAGNFVDVEGVILEAGKGNPYEAYVNNEKVTDKNMKLHSGDTVQFSNGDDIMEEWEGTQKEIAATFSGEGTGALGVFEGTGQPGIESTMTGKVSGKTVTRITTEPSNVIFRRYNTYANGEKVIALTFDDGPSSYTTEILEVLAQNNAKATFFILGQNAEEDWAQEILRSEQEAGHQLCTHTYSHAESGRGPDKTGSLGYMTDTQIVTDVTKGMDVIKQALGVDTISTVMRAPSGYFDSDIAQVLQPYISAEINWNIDTTDWKQPGASYIASQLLEAYPGAVILFHDGGGDRSQTVEALRTALPQLAAEGYRFITIDEMLKYPASLE